MAYIRTILKGRIGTSEVWSINLNWAIFGLEPDVPDQAEVDGLLAALLAATTVTSVTAGMKQLVSAQGSITGWRVEKRAEDESTLNVSEGTLGTPIVPSPTASKTPQDAIVVSLRTSTPGPSGRGRFYWPALGAVLTADFLLQQPTPASTIAEFRTWLNAIGTAMNAYYAGASQAKTVVLIVRSVTNHSNSNVNRILVGNVLDTQRRRRDNLVETYQSVSYP